MAFKLTWSPTAKWCLNEKAIIPSPRDDLYTHFTPW